MESTSACPPPFPPCFLQIFGLHFDLPSACNYSTDVLDPCSTFWASNYSSYDRLSPAYQKFIDGLTAVNDAERFRIQAKLNGFKLRTEARGHPDNTGDAFQATHPIVRFVSSSPFVQLEVAVLTLSAIIERTLSLVSSRSTSTLPSPPASTSSASTSRGRYSTTCSVSSTRTTVRPALLSSPSCLPVADTLSMCREPRQVPLVEVRCRVRSFSSPSPPLTLYSPSLLTRSHSIWSNPVVNHLATFDFTEYRAGDRAVVLGEKPVRLSSSAPFLPWLTLPSTDSTTTRSPSPAIPTLLVGRSSRARRHEGVKKVNFASVGIFSCCRSFSLSGVHIPQSPSAQ